MIELQLSQGKEGASARHERAFQSLREMHGPRLYRFCLRLCDGRTDDAADLSQETWVAAFESLPRFQSRAQVTTWLFRIAVYKGRQMRTAAPPFSPLDNTDDAPGTPSAPDTAPTTLVRLELANALRQLTDAQREAFLLVKAEQFTHKEAARILDIPQGTVQARVHEAVRRLRLILTPTEETDALR